MGTKEKSPPKKRKRHDIASMPENIQLMPILDNIENLDLNNQQPMHDNQSAAAGDKEYGYDEPIENDNMRQDNLQGDKDGFIDVTSTLKKSKRNKTNPNYL